MNSSYPTLFCVVYRGQQAIATAGAQMPMRGGHTYHTPDDILPPAAVDIIDDMGEELDENRGMRRPNPRSFPIVKTGFKEFEWNLQKWMI